MSAPLIELSHIRKSFDGGRSFAVDDVSLAVERGGFIALVGGSGSGKTTTLKTLNGLVAPDSGAVRIEGAPIDPAAAHLLRRRIGYVFQEVGLFPHMSVGENISITPRLAGRSRAQMAQRVDALLDLVCLPRAFAGRAPAALSGGQRQRVGLARALAAAPHILLMDEPFGALDPVTRDELGGEVRRLHDQLGLTTVMVTHDVTEAVLLADRMVIMANGRVRADGAPAALLAHEDAQVRALLDTPRRQAERVRARLDAAHA